MAIAVVQLGLAISFDFLHSFPLISGTTRGTSSAIRKALELSITTGPSFSQIFLAKSTLKSPPTARKTTSHDRARSIWNSSSSTVPSLPQSCCFPALRAEEKSRSSDTGRELFCSTFTISTPTAPVAPATPTVKPSPPLITICLATDILARLEGILDTRASAPMLTSESASRTLNCRIALIFRMQSGRSRPHASFGKGRENPQRARDAHGACPGPRVACSGVK
mmetsp:Transcript_8663/g.32632  ORF Transcript_8663/g.32632 Transcript_8663/m.32632 type:complete len:223 (-) Transcript_8663:8-676(-)